MKRLTTPLALAACACLLLAGCSDTREGDPAAQPDAERPASTSESAEAPGGDFAPTEQDRDPTERIEGVTKVNYSVPDHVQSPRRVAYDRQPPMGGAHDAVWAPCNGVVFEVAVRSEHLVHSMEHGAVWITYDPDAVSGDALDALADRVRDQPYTVMSPYPGQDRPVSLQSWGRQLKVDSGDDERVDRFIAATRANQYLTPEPGAPCDAPGGGFDQDDPPPFDPSPPGPDALPVDGG